MVTMSGNDWSDSLFKDEKGDSLGDGTWGKPEEPKLAPVAWDKLPEAPDPKKKVRARLATPAPGSQKESGLLDIKQLAPSLAAGIRDGGSEPAHKRQPTPAPVDPPRGARLATAAKGSAGSGLIDVQELARMQEKPKAADSVAEAAIEAMNSSASMSRDALGVSGTHNTVTPPPDVDLDDEVPAGGQSKLFLVIGLLAVAFVGMAIYVLTSM
ncbi:hypothetical protein [Paraliomyxa miuraensis]|uniref:hypothetical protein n=1 Tax=Paraliomyxa miuraensis TaxID=376150 RepID=UPI00225C2D3E|nr:hypothetical protein [Paraliomyxa miuraensis]MCX4244366.1 hypothetical protein [Paraliomyxa miuraensis]